MLQIVHYVQTPVHIFIFAGFIWVIFDAKVYLALFGFIRTRYLIYIYIFYRWFSILIVKLVVKEWPNQRGDPGSIPRGFESKKFWITYFWLYKAQISAYLDQLSWMNWMNSVFVIYLDILIYMFCFKFMEFAICFSNRKRWSCSA